MTLPFFVILRSFTLTLVMLAASNPTGATEIATPASSADGTTAWEVPGTNIEIVTPAEWTAANDTANGITFDFNPDGTITVRGMSGDDGQEILAACRKDTYDDLATIADQLGPGEVMTPLARIESTTSCAAYAEVAVLYDHTGDGRWLYAIHIEQLNNGDILIGSARFPYVVTSGTVGDRLPELQIVDGHPLFWSWDPEIVRSRRD